MGAAPAPPGRERLPEWPPRGRPDERPRPAERGRTIARELNDRLQAHAAGSPYVPLQGGDNGETVAGAGLVMLTVPYESAAETLAVILEKILVCAADTDFTPFDVGACGSSTAIIAGGDDYELCFTAHPNSRESIQDLTKMLGVPLARIGQVKRGKGVSLLGAEGRPAKIEGPGFDHFSAP